MTLGLKDLYYAVMSEKDGVETYAQPKKFSEALTADLSVNVAEATLYADDALNESEAEFVNGTLKLGIKDLTNEVLADILGQELDEEGVLWAGDGDTAPFVAIGFRANKGGGKYRYIWLQRVKFKQNSDSFETKGESISFKTPEIEGTFSKSLTTGKWKADYTGLPTDEIAKNWFTAVKTYTPAA